MFKKVFTISSLSLLSLLIVTEPAFAFEQDQCATRSFVSGRTQQVYIEQEDSQLQGSHLQDFDEEQYIVSKCTEYRKYIEQNHLTDSYSAENISNYINRDAKIHVNIQVLDQICKYKETSAWKMKNYIRKEYSDFEFCKNKQDRKNKCIDVQKIPNPTYVKRIYTPYQNNKIHGLQRVYASKGAERRLIEVNNYYKDNLDGLSYTFDLQGNLIAKTHYHHGQRNGLSYEYFTDGSIYKETPYVKDKKHGIEKEYNSSGILVSEISYFENVHDGIYNLYNNDGNKICEATYSQGQLEGLMRKFFSNGIISNEINFNNNVAQGINKTYYPNGNLKSQSYLVNGQKEGDYYYYYNSGKLRQHCLTKNGVFHGKCIIYYENTDQVQEINYYNRGAKQGLSIHYDEHNRKISEIQYVDNQKHGIATYFRHNRPFIAVDYFEGKIAKGYCFDGQKNLHLHEVTDFLNENIYPNCDQDNVKKLSHLDKKQYNLDTKS